MHVAFKRVSKIEATYGRSLVNVKVTSSLSYIASILSTHVKLRDSGNPPLRTIFPPYVRCLYFIYARKNYATVEIHPYARSSLHTYVASILSTHVKTTRQWKFTLTYDLPSIRTLPLFYLRA